MYQTPPYYYDYINSQESFFHPSCVHVHDTSITRYFEKYLLERAMSPFKFTLPKDWARNYFLYTLYCRGYLTVFETDKFGKIFQQCGLKGYNVFYQPTQPVVANPLIKMTDKLRFGVNCTLIKLRPNYTGIMDVVTFYASQLAMATETASVNMFNNKLSYVFFAKNKSAAESYKKAYDEIAEGRPMTVLDTKFKPGADEKENWAMFQQNLGQNYIYSDILADMRTLEDKFDTFIGIPNAKQDKKERMVVDEVKANDVETKSNCEIWFEELTEGIEETRKMFGFSEEELNVEWRNPPEKEDDVRLTEQKGQDGRNTFDNRTK